MIHTKHDTVPPPLISIIIATLNTQDTLAACIESIVYQTYKNYEIIIIDGNSTDNTHAIIRNYSKSIAYWESEPDSGVYEALNKGIKKARGTWLYFLGSDDLLYDKNVLSRIFNDYGTTATDVLYGNVVFRHSKKKWLGRFDLWKLTQHNICHQALFFKKSIFSVLGFYDCRYKILADYEFNFRWIANPRIRRRYIDEIIAVYNETGLSGQQCDEFFLENFTHIKNEAFKQASILEKMIYKFKALFNIGKSPRV